MNIHHHTYLQFFSWYENFWDPPSTYFQICRTLLSVIITMLYIISAWLTHFITRTSYFLTLFSHFSQTHTPTSHLRQPAVCSLCLWAPVCLGLVFVCLSFLRSTCKRSCGICLFLSGSFHIAQCPQGPSSVVANGKISYIFFMAESSLYVYRLI